jgi:16S rRNA (guanine527-N7)-methyltransferase
MRSRHPRLDPDQLLLSGAAALGIHLSPDQLESFCTYREEILRWTARTNLTALRSPAEIVREGFLDSLGCLALIPPEADRALDIGSGAGFPALPLKLVRPALDFTLVEASRKKATFLRHMARTLGLEGIRVVQVRAEALAVDPTEVGGYDVATARAVAPPPEQARLVRPLLRFGGAFLLQLGLTPLAPNVLDSVLALGFAVARELTLPPARGRPERRVLALRRIG